MKSSNLPIKANLPLLRLEVRLWTAALGLAVASAMIAHAQVIYVDAVPGVNTFPTSAFASSPAQDNLWGLRAFGTGNTIYESSGVASGTEDSPEIYTILSGLTPGLPYHVWVNFYDVTANNIENWPIRAGFSSGNLTLFAYGGDGGAGLLNATPAALANTLSYVNPPKFDDGGNRNLLAGYLGQAVADAQGEIRVYVDDLPSTIGANNRTWYDGLSYELVPEPSALALGLVGLAALLLVRGHSLRRS